MGPFTRKAHTRHPSFISEHSYSRKKKKKNPKLGPPSLSSSMTSTSPLKHFSPADLTSFFPTTSFLFPFTTPLLPLPSKPIPSLSISLKKKQTQQTPIVALIAQTSDWAQQEEEEEEEGLAPGVSDWEAEGEVEGESAGEGEGVVVGGGDGFVEESYKEPPKDAKLFVGNLPYDVDSERLAQLFDKAGIVEVTEVIYNRETDQSRGFGFVTMNTIEEAEKAVEMFHRIDVSGRLLTVNKAAPRGSRPERPPQEFEPSFRIYVGNLPWQVDDARLEQVFSEHGKVISARVVYDRESGRSRGFGFVTLASQSELDDAIAALDGQNLDGRALRVNVAEERPQWRGSF